MLPELGLFALILALCLASLQCIVFASSFKYNINNLNLMRPLALGQTFFVLCSFLILATAFLLDDFSVLYVAQHSNSALPFYYKFTAVWGAHEGSLLLWITILSCWILAVVMFSRNWPRSFGNKVLAILSVVNLGFLILLLTSSNPFLRDLPITVIDGADLNPLLQDFGMISHPPFLYAGYVGCAVPFAFAMAALLENKVTERWAKLLQPWVLAAWVCLTIGIALGSWWAYYELGWGGWWFWDPVENASFMPWLTLTALLHCLITGRNKGQFLLLAIFIAIVTFGLSLLGTFLVRSGSIVSVHAFAADPERGVFILQFLAIVVGGALFLYGAKSATLKMPARHQLSLQNKLILGNNLILLLAAAAILLGTLCPMFYEIITQQKISVGYPYFNAVFVPLMLILFVALLPAILPRRNLLFFIIIISIAAAVLFLYLWFGKVQFNAALGLTFAFAIIISTLLAWHKNINKKSAMALAHLGLAITVIGVSITPAYEIEKDLPLQIGDTVKIANYTVHFNNLKIIDGANYIAFQGAFQVRKDNLPIATIYPEKRIYLVQELPMTETAILPGLLQDIYVALGQQLDAQTWSTRVYYKPFVRWIWLGALVMALGGIIAIVNKRYVK